jgi:hypothetical protein
MQNSTTTIQPKIEDDYKWISKVRDKIDLIKNNFSGFGVIRIEIRHGKVDYITLEEGRQKI